ncbi:hypothetical protein BO78DRAFT_147266 [Aspergillus sclerotiicarbonarius CBS 121057]|uniref:Uncharacterized protein n=1 Tax=Aspergillus sclerotiicarbonarius (strain CBS 121057 / IBT 28362) TaxID=1448318 RepID=A0A319E5Y3_ASPSB|nr:hypothetical protein BO78DRAFT_147266 [Aspergillus sclerotiicarbonarius CBS 121057]
MSMARKTSASWLTTTVARCRSCFATCYLLHVSQYNSSIGGPLSSPWPFASHPPYGAGVCLSCHRIQCRDTLIPALEGYRHPADAQGRLLDYSLILDSPNILASKLQATRSGCLGLIFPLLFDFSVLYVLRNERRNFAFSTAYSSVGSHPPFSSPPDIAWSPFFLFFLDSFSFCLVDCHPPIRWLSIFFFSRRLAQGSLAGRPRPGLGLACLTPSPFLDLTDSFPATTPDVLDCLTCWTTTYCYRYTTVLLRPRSSSASSSSRANSFDITHTL